MSGYKSEFLASGGSGAFTSLPNCGLGGRHGQFLSPVSLKSYFLNCVGMYVGISMSDPHFLQSHSMFMLQ